MPLPRRLSKAPVILYLHGFASSPQSTKARYLAERGVNIENIEQHVVRGFFLMDMLVDLKDLTIDLYLWSFY